MKRYFILIIIISVAIPSLLYALVGAPPALSGINVLKKHSFGGKVSSVKKCNCPTKEPEKRGFKFIEYSIFWNGSKKESKELFLKPNITKLYNFKKVDSGIWQLGKYEEKAEQCLYITEADYAVAAAKAAAGIVAPPDCSGKYEADGTILFTGTGK